MKTLVTSAMLVMIFSHSCEAMDNANCSLRKGLYEQRILLKEEYAARVGNDYFGNKEIADKLMATIRSIDKEYYDFMNVLWRAYQGNKSASISTCCTVAKDDPVASQVCNIVSYLAKAREDKTAFINSFPNSEKAFETLWTLDKIVFAHSSAKDTTQPKIFLPNGPVYAYIDELFRIVTSGNEEAIYKYFNLYLHADGEYGEYILNQIITLFQKHPSIILRYWDVIRKYKDPLANLKEYLSTEERLGIENDFQRLCDRNDKRCKEILSVLRGDVN